MLLEAFLLFTLYQVLSDNQMVQHGGAYGAPVQVGALHYVAALVVFVAYLATFGRTVWTAFTRQGVVQGLLAVFLYPVYLMWNLTSLIRASTK